MRQSIVNGVLGPIAAAFALGLAGCGGSSTDDLDVGYAAEIDEWRAKRIERLRSPTGYLALAGLFWLDKGENTFGSDGSNNFVFPKKAAPAFAGAFFLEDGIIRIEVQSGVDVLHEGEPVRSMRLYHDQDRDHERTVLQLGSLSWWAIKRGDRLGIRLRDAESAVLASFDGVENYETDRRWRISAEFVPHDPLKFIPIENEIGIVTNELSAGEIVFELGGKTRRLDVLGNPGDEQFFVIFADETNGLETYGAGRFLYVRAADEDGKITIDFNKAYNPPCAFSDFTTCPLPPPQNRIAARVTAGEKIYKK